MEFFVIYLLVSIEKIAAVLISAEVIWITIVVPSAVILGVCAFVCLLDGDMEGFAKGLKKYYPIKTVIALVVSSILLSALGKMLPSQKEMAVIVGSGVVYNAVTSEDGRRIGNKAVQALESKVDAILKEEIPAGK